MLKNYRLTILLISALVVRFIFSFVTWHPDVFNHMDWGVRYFEYGPEFFYKGNVWNFTWPNQPPGTIYLFAAVRQLYEFVFNVFWWININVPPFPSKIMFFLELNLYPAMLKLPAILADVGSAYLIYKILLENKLKKYALFAATIFLINPVIWYNSSVWGQYDSLINFFALLSVYLLMHKRLVLAIIFFTLSIYTKASLLIFAPILFVLAVRQKYSLINWLTALILSTSIIGLLTHPFADKNVYVWLFELYKDKVFVDQLQVITANAFNLWAGLTGIHEQPHDQLLGPLTYQVWGLILFTTASLPALYLVFKKQDLKSLIWAMAITAFASFMLMTNMHERYLFPLFIPLTMLLAYDKRLMKLYIAISIISLLNLYNYWWTPRIEFIVEAMSAQEKLLPRILGFVNFSLFVMFYYKFLRQNKLTKI